MKNKQWKSAGWLASLMFIGGLSSCSNGGQSQKSSALDTQPIAGSVEVINGDSIWVCNLSALKDTVVLPLSYFADELQMKLQMKFGFKKAVDGICHCYGFIIHGVLIYVF